MTTSLDPFAGYAFSDLTAPEFSVNDRRPWGAYGRISRKDPREGFGAHVKIEDQLDQCTAYIHDMDPGADVLRFQDNASAWDPSAVRHEYESMVAMLTRGELKGIVGWHSDRLTRQTLQQAVIWRAVETTKAQLHTVKSGWIKDPTMWQMEGIISERESRVKSHRAVEHHRRLAKQGTWSGGRRTFGYDDVKTDHGTERRINEREAEALRSIAARVLGGDSLSACVRWLEAEGIGTARGGQWNTSLLGQMLRRPLFAGMRTYGKHSDGSPRVVGRAAWEPIFDLPTHEALVRKLGDPSRRTSTTSKSKYLLAGLARCACGEVLRARPGRRDKAATVYTCATGRHFYRRTDVVDDAVTEHMVARLERIDSAGVFVDESAEAEEAALTVKRDELVARRKDYARKAALNLIDADMAAEVADAIASELAAVTRALDVARDASSRPLAALEGMTGPLARQAWDGASLGRKRELLRLFTEKIEARSNLQEKGWNPDAQLSVTFRKRPGVA